jgi:hypothetical protein
MHPEPRSPHPSWPVPDADRSGDRLGMRYHLADHERSRSCGLPSQHAWPFRRQPVVGVLGVALPVGSDVARVADRDAVHVGRVAERVADLERRGLLPSMRNGLIELTTVTPPALAELAHDVERVVEAAAHGTTLAPWMSACASLPERDVPVGMMTAAIMPARAA